MEIVQSNPELVTHEDWMKRSQGWKDLDDMRLMLEAIEIMLQLQVPKGDVVGTDNSAERGVRLMHIELKRRLNAGKTQEQIYREGLELIHGNAEKLMPEYPSEEQLLKWMKGTKNPVLKKMFSIRQYCRTVLGIKESNITPSSGPESA